MALIHAITVLFWLAVATLAIGLARRARLWSAGRAVDVEWSGLLAIPKRYFVDLHHVVARDPYIARTHIAVAGGAVAALALAGLNYGLAIYSRRLDFAILAAAGVVRVAAPPQDTWALIAWRLEPAALLADGICAGTWRACRTSAGAFTGGDCNRGVAAAVGRIGGTCPWNRRWRPDEARGRRTVASRVPSPS